MARSFLTPINLNNLELWNARVQNVTRPTPAAGTLKGLIVFEPADNTLYWWDGNQWIAAKAAAGAVPASTVTTEAIGDTGVVGVSTNFAREDHKHGMPLFGAITAEQTMGSVSSNGVSTNVARSDHQHGNPSTSGVAPTGLNQPGATAYQGSNNQPSRGDHVHGWGVALANMDMGGFLVTNAGAPVSGTDLANKNYVDNVSAGLTWKAACRASDTSGNPAALTGLYTLDGVALAAGNRVLAKNWIGVNAANNGIYIAASGVWTRATDADSSAEIPGAAVFVEEGTVNADTAWVCTDNPGFVLGTDNMHWAQFAGGGTVQAGAGMTQVGNQLNVIANANGSIVVAADDIAVGYAGSTGNFGAAGTAARSDHAHAGTYVAVAGDSMTGVLTANGAGVRITSTGTINASTFTAQGNGGGLSATSGGFVNLSGSGASLVVGGSSSSVDFSNLTSQALLPAITPTLASHAATKAYVDGLTTVKTSKYTTATIGGAISQVVTHNLNTYAVLVQVYSTAGPGDTVECDVERTNSNQVTLRFAAAPTTNQYSVVVIG